MCKFYGQICGGLYFDCVEIFNCQQQYLCDVRDLEIVFHFFQRGRYAVVGELGYHQITGRFSDILADYRIYQLLCNFSRFRKDQSNWGLELGIYDLGYVLLAGYKAIPYTIKNIHAHCTWTETWQHRQGADACGGEVVWGRRRRSVQHYTVVRADCRWQIYCLPEIIEQKC